MAQGLGCEFDPIDRTGADAISHGI